MQNRHHWVSCLPHSMPRARCACGCWSSAVSLPPHCICQRGAEASSRQRCTANRRRSSRHGVATTSQQIFMCQTSQCRVVSVLDDNTHRASQHSAAQQRAASSVEHRARSGLRAACSSSSLQLGHIASAVTDRATCAQCGQKACAVRKPEPLRPRLATDTY